jgi:hypothetical protein
MDPEAPLADPYREAFARALARGVPRLKAIAIAGLERSRSGADGIARRAEVKARIEALARREARIAMAAAAPTLAALARIVDALHGATGARAREARLTLKLIAQLRAVVEAEMRDAVEPPPPAFVPIRQLTTDEWIAEYAHLGACYADASQAQVR